MKGKQSATQKEATRYDDLNPKIQCWRYSMDKQVFNFKEAQTALGVGKGTIYTLMDEGQLPFFCVGRRRYVTRQALEDFLISDNYFCRSTTTRIAGFA
jgi:excisionase family DNA binding protein